LVFDAHLSAFTVVVFLLAAYRLQSKEIWDWRDIATVTGGLALVTYGYFAGRVLAPLFALGLLLLATRKRHVVDVFKIWLAYGLTLVPLVLFGASGNPWQLLGWLFSMFFLLLAYARQPRVIATGFKSTLLRALPQ
jgi:hypothetical protein